MSAPIIPMFKPHSGMQPGSAAGRPPRHPQTATPDPEPRRPQRLGVTSGELWIWLMIVALIAACIVVGAI